MRDEKWRGGGGLFFFLLVSVRWTQPFFYVSLLEKPLESSHKTCRGVCVSVCMLRGLTDIWLPDWHRSGGLSFSMAACRLEWHTPPEHIVGLSSVRPWICLIIIRTADAVPILRSVCVPIERLVRAGKWSEREREKPRWGRGGKESVVAEEANVELDLREKVYTTHNDRPSGQSVILGRSGWCGSFWFARVDTRRLLNHHYAPTSDQYTMHSTWYAAKWQTLPFRLVLSFCPATGFSL